MAHSPDIWLRLQVPEGLSDFVVMAADSLTHEESLESSGWLRALLATCQTYHDRGEAYVVESLGDLLARHLFNLEYHPEVMRGLIPYLAGIYRKTLEIVTPEREMPLKVKFCSMAAVQAHMEAVVEPDSEQEQLKEADEFSNAAVGWYWEYVLGPKPKDVSYQESLAWVIQAFPTMEQAGKVAAERDYFFGHFLYEWMKKQLLNDWGLRFQLQEATAQFNDIHHRNGACLLRCAEFWKAMKEPRGQLTALEKASFLYILELRDLEVGRGLARDALALGDGYMFDLQTEGAQSSAIINLRERLYRLSRLAGDKGEIEHRLNLHCVHLRRDADQHYVQEEWESAAQIYSNLSYRYFNAAEYTDSVMLYRLSIYFFEKAEFCRLKAPDQPRDDPDAPDPKVYRRLEANGFIYGASAKLSERVATDEFFDEAADQLAEAAQMLFQQFATHDFYNSTAHYFYAQAELTRAVMARDLGSSHQHVAKSIHALGQCFQMFRSVYGAYQSILRSAIEPDKEPEYEKLRPDLVKNGYPDPDQLIDLAKKVRSHYQVSDFRGFPEGLDKLRRALIYINPMG